MTLKQAKRPSLSPQNLNPYSWYYEYPSRIDLIHEVRDADGRYLKTVTIRIPWRKLKASLKRCQP